MHYFPLSELLAIRANHTLRLAAQLCERTTLPARLWSSAAEIISLNLELHNYHEVASILPELKGRAAAEVDAVAGEIGRLIDDTTRV